MANIQVVFNNGRLSLTGHLTMLSVPGLEVQIKEIADGFGKEVLLDLSATDHNDTAGLAWLLNFKGQLLRANKQLYIENAPSSLRKLSQLSDADKILGLN